MAFKAAFVGRREHFVVYTRGVANTKYGYSPVCQFLADPVHSSITLSADQHLRFAAQCFADGFNQCGGFARSRRTVNHHHIAGLQGFADGRFRPLVDSVFPLDRAADAHRRMASNENVGKIVLTVAP